MTEENAEDAVGYFSRTARQFHGLYKDQAEFHERLRIWHDLLDRYAPRSGSSLDMGCGPGVFSFYLAEKGGRVVGVDGATDMVAHCEEQRTARGLDNVRFVHARLPAVDERDLGRAGLVISSSVVEYVEDLDATLALFARLLEPSGVLILSMPNLASVSRIHQRMKFRFTRSPEIYAHIRHFSLPSLLERRLRPLGLSFLEAHYYAHVTRLSKVGNRLRLPKVLTEDLFVAVFRKSA